MLVGMVSPASNTLKRVRRELAGNPHSDLVLLINFVLCSSPDTSYNVAVRSANLAVIVLLRVAVPLFLLQAARHVLVSLRMIAPNRPRHTPLKTRHVLLNFITVPLIPAPRFWHLCWANCAGWDWVRAGSSRYRTSSYRTPPLRLPPVHPRASSLSARLGRAPRALEGRLGRQRTRCRRRDGPALLSLLQRQSRLSNSDRARTDPLTPASQFCGTNIGATILLARVLQLYSSGRRPPLTRTRTRTWAHRQGRTRAPGMVCSTHSRWARTSARSRRRSRRCSRGCSGARSCARRASMSAGGSSRW